MHLNFSTVVDLKDFNHTCGLGKNKNLVNRQSHCANCTLNDCNRCWIWWQRGRFQNYEGKQAMSMIGALCWKEEGSAVGAWGWRKWEKKERERGSRRWEPWDEYLDEFYFCSLTIVIYSLYFLNFKKWHIHLLNFKIFARMPLLLHFVYFKLMWYKIKI